MAFEFAISAGVGVPIFRQIADQARLAVATGRLSAGDALPSVRALAERLLVNPNTVARAYAELSRDGVIESRHGKGVFISTPREVYSRAERQRRLAPLVDALVTEGVSLGFPPDELLEAVRQRLAEVTEGTDVTEGPRRTSP
jgi:GntR family transcriptional regulator